MSEFVFSEGRLEGSTWEETVEVPAQLRYLEGHFPGDPIVPGVAQIVTLAEERARVGWPDLGVTTGMRRLKFMSALRPGHVLTLKLERKPGKVTFRLSREGAECSLGTLLFDE